ncbi:hypothetical protein bthur0003_64190 [Bacillus thuringiensis serovar thuringiensis str. T01001]|nr:hypothetical protein bthur0003_64190 [Bacillus thuringiensis serovar thuringiensis str. T01001]EEM62099.1 hypothetical protein bthur0008_63370 [Bacillus thuringiensis serovar berliner ATCC 10792]KEH50287.1 hypothetical protein BG09_0990 [Bacillus thuringiensis serovar kurstaki str. HD-1]
MECFAMIEFNLENLLNQYSLFGLPFLLIIVFTLLKDWRFDK